MNYRFIIIEEIKRFREANPTYSFGEMLISALTCLENKPTFTRNTLLQMTDEQFYSALSRAVITEKEEQLTEEDIKRIEEEEIKRLEEEEKQKREKER